MQAQTSEICMQASAVKSDQEAAQSHLVARFDTMNLTANSADRVAVRKEDRPVGRHSLGGSRVRKARLWSEE